MLLCGYLRFLKIAIPCISKTCWNLAQLVFMLAVLFRLLLLRKGFWLIRFVNRHVITSPGFSRVFFSYSKKPTINPPASPSRIGKGKPGKISFFCSMKKVMIEPAKMPTIEAMQANMLKLKNMVPESIE